MPNLNAAPIDLYDYPRPGLPRWFVVRRAIAEHRNGDRAPLAVSARGNV